MASNNRIYPLTFWRLEAQNQGVSGALLSLKAPGEGPSLLLLPSGVAGNPWPSSVCRYIIQGPEAGAESQSTPVPALRSFQYCEGERQEPAKHIHVKPRLE